MFFTEDRELPLGFGMALAQNEGAMKKFESLSDAEKDAILRKAHKVKSKNEMRALVESFASDSHGGMS